MSFAVREVVLDFDLPQQAVSWVDEHEPKGIAVGSVTWQLVLHDINSSQVRLLLAFPDVKTAQDWTDTALPDLAGARSLTVRVSSAAAYVPGNLPTEPGPGRVWVPAPDGPLG